MFALEIVSSRYSCQVATFVVGARQKTTNNKIKTKAVGDYRHFSRTECGQCLAFTPKKPFTDSQK
jgi:hypothetical protein